MSVHRNQIRSSGTITEANRTFDNAVSNNRNLTGKSYRRLARALRERVHVLRGDAARKAAATRARHVNLEPVSVTRKVATPRKRREAVPA